MPTYIARRLLYTIPVLFGITLFTFAFLRVTGDPCTALLGEHYTPARCEEVRIRYGLDQPLHVQYARYVSKVVSGDLGRSIVTKRPVASELKDVFPATVELALAAMTIAVLVGIPLGVLAAARHNSALDLVSMVAALVGGVDARILAGFDAGVCLRIQIGAISHQRPPQHGESS